MNDKKLASFSELGDLKARSFFIEVSQRQICKKGIVPVHLVDQILDEAMKKLPGRTRKSLETLAIQMSVFPQAEFVDKYREEHPPLKKDDPIRPKSRDDVIYTRIVQKAEVYRGNKIPTQIAATIINDLARQFRVKPEEVWENGRQHFPPLDEIQKAWARGIQGQQASPPVADTRDEDSQLRFIKPKGADEPQRPPILTTITELAEKAGSKHGTKDARDRAIEELQIGTGWRNLSLERNRGRPFYGPENIERCASRIKRDHPDFSIEEIIRLGVQAEAVQLEAPTSQAQAAPQAPRPARLPSSMKLAAPPTIPALPERRDGMKVKPLTPIQAQVLVMFLRDLDPKRDEPRPLAFSEIAKRNAKKPGDVKTLMKLFSNHTPRIIKTGVLHKRGKFYLINPELETLLVRKGRMSKEVVEHPWDEWVREFGAPSAASSQQQGKARKRGRPKREAAPVKKVRPAKSARAPRKLRRKARNAKVAVRKPKPTLSDLELLREKLAAEKARIDAELQKVQEVIEIMQRYS